MTDEELYQAVIRRMENFNISFEEAIKEIKEMYPEFIEILDKFIHPTKIQIAMDCTLWEQITELMGLVSYSHKVSEERIQRQLGVVNFLYKREFGDDWL